MSINLGGEWEMTKKDREEREEAGWKTKAYFKQQGRDPHEVTDEEWEEVWCDKLREIREKNPHG